MQIFTPAEANALLEQVRPLAEEMVARRRAYRQARDRHTELVVRIASNGGDLTPSDVTDAAGAVERADAEVARCVRKVHALGAQVKDLDEGLLDFPALRGEEIVLLCWKVGEDEIRYWHTQAEGFAGRRPLPL